MTNARILTIQLWVRDDGTDPDETRTWRAVYDATDHFRDAVIAQGLKAIGSPAMSVDPGDVT